MIELPQNIPDEPIKVQRKAKGMPAYKTIILEENENIPPTGLYVGVNGRGYLIRPGEKVHVPVAVIEVLRNAVTASPVTDPTTRRVLGHRNKTRYPFNIVDDAA